VPRHRARLVVNLVNGSTIFGMVVARAGGARLAKGPQGLLTATGYRPAVPVAPAFTVGNVIIVNRRHPQPLPAATFAHEARHATQYAWCGGLLMLPLYFIAVGASWALCGNIGAWNAFERQAGLADGGYPQRPLRPALARALSVLRVLRPTARRSPAAGPGSPSAPEPGGPAESTASPSR
jgi:hypothetical protein